MFQLCNPKHMVFHYDVKRDLVETIDGIVMYSSYYICVVSLNMAYWAKTYRWWLIINKVVSRFVYSFIHSRYLIFP
jgi:hypothetical protein